MKIKPRWYQQEAHDAAVEWVKKSISPCLIELPTGAGKSIVVAMIADTISKLSGGKKILCLQPSKELLEQNHDKFKLTGSQSSLFSASVNQKSTRHSVVFATPQSVSRSVSRFTKGDFCAVIIDEGHLISDSTKKIIEEIKNSNKNLRVIGMTATPFRLGDGYIFSMWPNGDVVTEEYGIDQYYTKLVYSMSAKELVDSGFLTPPLVLPVGQHYDTSGLIELKNGRFKQDTVEQAFIGKGRLTSKIVEDIISKSQGHQSVMIFASTIKHCLEVMESLPKHNSFMITGETNKHEREKLLRRFKSGELKYAVSVETLTTGLDVTSVSIIAFLRRTSSAGLFMQMAGRGLRLHDGKKACVLLDYAENIDNLFEDRDVFKPIIKARPCVSEKTFISCTCPECGTNNSFSSRKNEEGYGVDNEGYFIDLDNNRIECEHGPIPAHYGRRCVGLHIEKDGSYQQCTYRYTSKQCHSCQSYNDITARKCIECSTELIDPNKVLTMEYRALVRSPNNRQCNIVEEYSFGESMTRSGRECWRVNFKTPYRSFTIWIMKDPKGEREYYDKKLWESLDRKQPKTVEYQKDGKSNFYRVYSYNKKADEEPEIGKA